MARNAVASSSKAPIKIKKGSAKPIVTVSEPGTDADEYTDEEYDDGELEFDAQDEEEEGVAQYAPDDWDGEDDDDASSSEGRSSRSASDDEGENEDADDLVCPTRYTKTRLSRVAYNLAKATREPPINAIINPHESPEITQIASCPGRRDRRVGHRKRQ
jgi:hypothetical protein